MHLPPSITDISSLVNKSLIISWAFGLLLAFFIWKVDFLTLFAQTISGMINSFEIICIIFGATLLLAVLNKLRITNVLQMGFASITRDRRIQTMMIPWFFGAFIESAAGFGAPAALAAPLLVGLGVAFLPKKICEKLRRPGIVYRPMAEDAVELKLALTWKKGRYLSAAANCFLEEFKNT